jgi:hypothetical protein
MIADVCGWRDVWSKNPPGPATKGKKRLEFGVGFLCEMELGARANWSGALTWEWIQPAEFYYTGHVTSLLGQTPRDGQGLGAPMHRKFIT